MLQHYINDVTLLLNVLALIESIFKNNRLARSIHAYYHEPKFNPYFKLFNMIFRI